MAALRRAGWEPRLNSTVELALHMGIAGEQASRTLGGGGGGGGGWVGPLGPEKLDKALVVWAGGEVTA